METWGEWQQISDALDIKRHDEIFPEGVAAGKKKKSRRYLSPINTFEAAWVRKQTKMSVAQVVAVDKAA